MFHSDPPTHELWVNKNGTTSLKHLASGEVMHSSIGPREEALKLYVEQSKIQNLLEIPSENDSPLVLFDVGLGAATNALAVLQTCPKRLRPLEIHSFETDLTGLALALKNSDQFPFFEGFTSAIESLLTHKEWRSQNLLWKVWEGDFRDNAKKCPKADLVFFDFYSPKVNPELWSIETFKTVFEASKESAELFTYSASTKVRVALLLSGFHVGFGRSTGAKCDTTIAAKKLDRLASPLDARWLLRLFRSHDPLPVGTSNEHVAEVLEKIKTLPQFTIA